MLKFGPRPASDDDGTHSSPTRFLRSWTDCSLRMAASPRTPGCVLANERPRASAQP
jgi:hypothetical protein